MTPPLTPERWQALEPLLDAALEAPLERRARAIAELAGSDHALRDEALALLGKWTESGVLPLLGKPAPEVFSALLDDEMDGSFETLAAALAGRYTLERRLGQGGMATVYLAFDLKHDRRVALKVLRPELAAVVGADRFLAEIKTTANLRHPHILPLHDSGEAGSFLFYVMPYVEGESLAQRLERDKQLSVDEAVSIATKVSAALQHAHDRGVIHRDIKPANILLQDSEPVVADFGIALAVGAASGTRLTETGLSLGTPFYMSPEQATGDQYVGAASDTYALGCVLYEVLVGEPPYIGKTAQAVLGKIITGELAFPRKRRPAIPANVDAAIRRALEKLPADRFGRVADFASALSNPAFRHGEIEGESTRAATSRWKRLAVGAATVAAITSVALVSSMLTLLPLESRPPARFDLTPWEGQGTLSPAGSAGAEFALSPDGQRVVYRGAAQGGGYQLWRRSMDSLLARPIAGTEGAEGPVFSPDGLSVAFNVGQAMKTVSLLGGPVITVLSEGVSRGTIDWGPDGMLYYASTTGGIHRIPAAGGQPEGITDDRTHTLPDVLPDGRGILVTMGGRLIDGRIAVVEPGGNVRELFPGTRARFVPPGHVVYATSVGEGKLMAAPFDANRLEVTGPSVLVVDGIWFDIGLSSPQFAVSENGTLVYRAGSLAPSLEPTWIDREGKARPVEEGWVVRGTPQFASLALSPDDSRIALSTLGREAYDIWVQRLGVGTLSRITSSTGASGGPPRRPVWSPDGQFLTFVGPGRRGIHRARADGTGEIVTLLDSAHVGRQQDPVSEVTVSAAGDWLIYRVGSDTRSPYADIFALRVGVDSVGRPVLAEEYLEWTPALSPNDRWLAYVSNETGRQEVYVRPFPAVHSGKWMISTGGGRNPKWAHSGRELFYQNYAGELVAVSVETGATFSADPPRALFSTQGLVIGVGAPMYDVSGDDRRFLMLRDVSPADNGRLILVQNFLEELAPR